MAKFCPVASNLPTRQLPDCLTFLQIATVAGGGGGPPAPKWTTNDGPGTGDLSSTTLSAGPAGPVFSPGGPCGFFTSKPAPWPAPSLEGQSVHGHGRNDARRLHR